jgi:hypothetical protein
VALVVVAAETAMVEETANGSRMKIIVKQPGNRANPAGNS